jgi:methylmalonyl-CoA mutase N-terminal domain/subunit
MAYALSIARAYIDHVLERGLDIDEFARGLSFNFDIHGNLWEQVAKFRAGRRLWARILKEEYGATHPRSMQLRMIAGGGGGGLTIQQPENNIVRGAYYALASALSGTQTMALCSYDEAYTIPSERAARLSLRTMQILMHETGVCDTVDPLAGSYFVETMTNRMEKLIIEIMDRIAAEGGIVTAVAEGKVQADVNRAAFEREKRLQSGDTKKVGVNCFVEDEEEEQPVAFHPYREEEAAQQIERLERIRRERDQETLHAALEKLKTDARTGQNVMPAVMDAVECYATVGEVCGVLKEVFGTYIEPVRF